MKNLIIAFILSKVLFAALPTLAQVDESKSDTLNIGKTRVIVKSVDTTENGVNKVNKEVIVVEKDKMSAIETDWFTLKVGLTNWINSDNKLEADPNFQALTINTGQSVNCQVNFIEQTLKLVDDRLQLVYGLGLDGNYYKLKNDISLSTDDQGIVITDESSVIDFKRNWLINEYVTIPMLLNLNFALQKGKKKEVYVLAGANFAYALQSRIRQKWESEDMKYVRRGKKDLNVNQFQVGYEVQLGFKNFMLYGKYYPDGIFKTTTVNPNLRSFSFGVVL